MSYVTASEESYVQVIADARGGFTCFSSPESLVHTAKEVTVETRAEMIDHLLEHRILGDLVPDEPIQRLQREMQENREGTL